MLLSFAQMPDLPGTRFDIPDPWATPTPTPRPPQPTSAPPQVPVAPGILRTIATSASQTLEETSADWDPFDDDKLSESLETIGDLSR